MLSHLSISNFTIAEQVELEFQPGMTVITGETGAGKSISLDALALALGDRADSKIVRHGIPIGLVLRIDVGAMPVSRVPAVDELAAGSSELLPDRKGHREEAVGRAGVDPSPVGLHEAERSIGMRGPV